MNSYEANHLLVFNNLIYSIYSIEECDLMRKLLIEKLQMVIEFDAADFYLASNSKRGDLQEPVSYQYEAKEQTSLEQLGLLLDLLKRDKSLVVRADDYLADEERTQRDYYQALYRPNHWHYALHMVFLYQGEFLGCLNLYKTIGSSNFSQNDMDISNLIKDHIALRLHNEKRYRQDHKLTIKEAVKTYYLTGKEHLILKKLLEGLDNNTICEELSISPNTLKKHIVNIYRKLKINNRTQLFKNIKESE